MTGREFSADQLRIDAAAVSEEIATSIRRTIQHRLRRRGAVIGLSGGIDSTVTAALCVCALGADRVVGLLMPERESSTEGLELGQLVGDWLDIRVFTEDITPILEAAGCYRRRDEAVRSVVPDYGDGDRCKIVVPDMVKQPRLPAYSLIVRSKRGTERRVRLTAEAYLGILAASSLKQRTRKMIEYSYADRFQFAVVGTPNRLEYDQGFFVKNGDGAADLKPIAHLFKSQVYELAEVLGVPEEVRRRPPTTDTYPLEQSQEEFYFSLPLRQMDVCMLGLDGGVSPEEVAAVVHLTTDQVRRAYGLIQARRSATRYLHEEPILHQRVPHGNRPRREGGSG